MIGGEATTAGGEPAFHRLPIIDPERCRGHAACVRSCEPGVLRVVSGKARLVHQERCTFCGACEAACPHSAIALPFDIVLAWP
jgi:thioredoxin reductase (NADPH)